MNYILFDHNRQNLFPFTHTRAVGEIRCGIMTMRERWELQLGKKVDTLTAGYLQALYPDTIAGEDHIYLNAGVVATEEIVTALQQLNRGDKLVKGSHIIAAHLSEKAVSLQELEANVAQMQEIHFEAELTSVDHPWDIFSHNDKALRLDFQLVTKGRESAPLPDGVTVLGPDQLFIEEGANIYPGCIINAGTGPVYIGKDVEILEGTLIRGPLAVCDHGVIKMGAKVYGATTIGPGCKVGGELNNVVFFANSNKAHDGYLGNAVIGEWCNLGADTNCSNLKNNYDEVKVWDEYQNKEVKTGLTFCGLLMGDHSKCGINTMFNTGTVVGVSCNLYGGSFPQKFIPSFSWGGSDGMFTYRIDKAMETANRMMGRRHKALNHTEVAAFEYIFALSAEQRVAAGME